MLGFRKETGIMHVQDQTTRWLKEQLGRLELWRNELASAGPDTTISSERISRHKAWLEAQLTVLARQAGHV